MDESRYMERALALAELGKGTVSPNPMVGCVIVHKNRIIGEGFHQMYGEAHAEVNAIASVKDPDLLPESTVYVTLEPCAHHGKTPPCANLLINKKVKRVVIACTDPFEQVSGQGIQLLQEAGVKVEVGLLQEEAIALNKRFFTTVNHHRPYIILKWAQTADGFIARENYDSKWISNDQARQLVHKWRTEEDGILVGKHTVLHDDPQLTARSWSGRNPTRIVLDSNLEIKKDAKVFNTEAPTLIMNALKEEQEGSIRWIKTDLNNPWSVTRKIHELGIQSVIVEGGTQVLNSFINENCWDEARVFISEQTFGKGIEAPKMTEPNQLEETIFDNQLVTYINNHG